MAPTAAIAGQPAKTEDSSKHREAGRNADALQPAERRTDPGIGKL
jgi:hypothetical protein